MAGLEGQQNFKEDGDGSQPCIVYKGLDWESGKLGFRPGSSFKQKQDVGQITSFLGL